jgi:hypothetical protein
MAPILETLITGKSLLMEEQEDFKANSAKDIVLIVNPTRYTV